MKKIIFAISMLGPLSAFASSQMDCVGKTNPQIKATVEIAMDQTIHTNLFITDGDFVWVDSTDTRVTYGDGPEVYSAGGATLKLVDGHMRNIRNRENAEGGIEIYTYETTWELSKGYFKTAMICSQTASNQ